MKTNSSSSSGLSRTWLSRARRAALAKRGVTLIEILIVLAIVGLIAGGVAVVAVPKYQEAQKKQAQIDARTIHPAAEKYRVDHTGEGCPTVELLREKKDLTDDVRAMLDKALAEFKDVFQKTATKKA